MLRQQARFPAGLLRRQPIEIDQEAFDHLVDGRILAVGADSLFAATPQRFQRVKFRTARASRQPEQLNPQLRGQALRGAGRVGAIGIQPQHDLPAAVVPLEGLQKDPKVRAPLARAPQKQPVARTDIERSEDHAASISPGENHPGLLPALGPTRA
jgi:hypothetical protein